MILVGHCGKGKGKVQEKVRDQSHSKEKSKREHDMGFLICVEVVREDQLYIHFHQAFKF